MVKKSIMWRGGTVYKIAEELIKIANDEIRLVWNSKGEGNSTFRRSQEGGYYHYTCEPPKPSKYGDAFQVIQVQFIVNSEGAVLFCTHASLVYNKVRGLKNIISKWGKVCQRYRIDVPLGQIGAGIIWATQDMVAKAEIYMLATGGGY